MKHFIDIKSFKKKQIDEIISLAKKIKKNPKQYTSSCKDKTLGLIFEKQSLRTRLSFNVGMQKLGGSVLELQSKDIGFDNKREKAEDVLNVFVPTMPNPTSGFLVFAPPDELTEVDMSIEDGIKYVVSGGIVSLEELKLTQASNSNLDNLR